MLILVPIKQRISKERFVPFKLTCSDIFDMSFASVSFDISSLLVGNVELLIVDFFLQRISVNSVED